MFSQSPGGGTITPLGTLVTIPISTGEPARVTMPKVVGMRGCDARSLLSSLGLTVVTQKVQTGNPNQVGYVISQEAEEPDAGDPGQHRDDRRGIEPQGNDGGGGGGGNGGGNGDGGGDEGVQLESAPSPPTAWPRRSCTTFPSTLPFAFPIPKPITAPSSFSDVAPVAASASLTRASTSSSLSISGA